MNDDANKKFYFAPLPKEEVEKVCQQLAEKRCDLQIWRKGLKREPVENFQIDQYDPETNTLTLTPQDSIFKKLTGSKYIDKDVLLKTTMGKLQYFSTGVLEYDKESKIYTLRITHELYKSQQRSNYRLQSSKHIQIQFKINETVYDGNDISASGVSFKIPKDDLINFPKGAEFFHSILRFNRMNFEIPKTIIMISWEDKSEDSPPDQYIVGAKFEKLPKVVEESLFRHINSEARAEEIRKNLL